MIDILAQFAAWWLPRVCAVCGFISDNVYLDLCSLCKRNLPWIDLRCYKCGEKLKTAHDAVLCQQCISTSPPYDRLCALFSYEPPLNKLINRLKFNRDLYPGKLFATLLQQAIQEKWYANQILPEVIIPVPLHIKRQHQRGYNQALELSVPIAKSLKIPIDVHTCKRIRNTPAQARLNKAQRSTNLVGAFIAERCNYEHVALVDDVVTTGSTIAAVSNVLLASGVKQIDVWCVCRA